MIFFYLKSLKMMFVNCAHIKRNNCPDTKGNEFICSWYLIFFYRKLTIIWQHKEFFLYYTLFDKKKFIVNLFMEFILTRFEIIIILIEGGNTLGGWAVGRNVKLFDTELCSFDWINLIFLLLIIFQLSHRYYTKHCIEQISEQIE